MVDKEILNRYKKQYIYEILECKDVRSSSALYAYAAFLNKKKIRFDFIPLYLEIFKTNNKFAVDVLLSGYIAKTFFDFIKVPNVFMLQSIFDILKKYKKNTLYEQTLRVFFGFLKKVYRSGGEGYRAFPMSISDVNHLGKYLDETKSQEFDLNRQILDILFFISELDNGVEKDEEKLLIAKQADRIRTDFFDSKRSLIKSMTDVLLEKSKDESPGIAPEGVYSD